MRRKQLKNGKLCILVLITINIFETLIIFSPKIQILIEFCQYLVYLSCMCTVYYLERISIFQVCTFATFSNPFQKFFQWFDTTLQIYLPFCDGKKSLILYGSSRNIRRFPRFLWNLSIVWNFCNSSIFIVSETLILEMRRIPETFRFLNFPHFNKYLQQRLIFNFS